MFQIGCMLRKINWCTYLSSFNNQDFWKLNKRANCKTSAFYLHCSRRYRRECMRGHVKKKVFPKYMHIYLMNITFHSIAKCTWCRFELTLPQQTLIKNYHKNSFVRCCMKLTVLLINRGFFTVVVLQCFLSRRKNDNTLSSWEQQELSSDVLHFKSNSKPPS